MAAGLLALGGIGGMAGAFGMSAMNRAQENKWQSPEQMQKPTGYAANDLQQIQELLRRHNAGELELPDEQVKRLSQAAAELGMEFKVESQPVKKFMFDAADTALFGLIPNEWRPYSIGEETHGESWSDRTAGSIGRVGGTLLGGGLLLKGGKMALGGFKGWMGKGTAATGAQRSWANAQPGGLLNMPGLLNPVRGMAGPGQFLLG